LWHRPRPAAPRPAARPTIRLGRRHPVRRRPAFPLAGGREPSRPAATRPCGAPMSADQIFVLGATHHTAPLAVRERLSLDAAATEALRRELAGVAGLREFTVLSTCNRVEFYGVGSVPTAAAEVQARFCAQQRFAPEEFEQFRLNLAGFDAVRHLLDVTAGLDSQLLGETEILGQVKEAYGKAQAHGHTGAVLNRVFQKAFQAAKHVRTDTAISEGQVSVANVA